MPLVPTMLALKITRGPDVLVSQEITFDEGTIEPVPLVGDQIIVSDGTQTLRGTVAARDFDYTQFLPGNEGTAAFVITLWADIVG